MEGYDGEGGGLLTARRSFWGTGLGCWVDWEIREFDGFAMILLVAKVSICLRCQIVCTDVLRSSYRKIFTKDKPLILTSNLHSSPRYHSLSSSISHC